MPPEMGVLLITAVSIGALHTLTGPDHYLPFIALSRSRGWSVSKTIAWTLICGSGHVISSVVLGLGGAALGWSLSRISWLEGIRGGLAAWAMLIFGLLYTAWGLYRAARNQPHKHFDLEENGDMYVFQHTHNAPVAQQERYRVTPWVMFIIFLLGPCEPMIPLLYLPAAQGSWGGMVLLVIVYTLVTLVTMLTMVLMGYYGISFLKTAILERYLHPIGGLTIFFCGAGMLWLGW